MAVRILAVLVVVSFLLFVGWSWLPATEDVVWGLVASVEWVRTAGPLGHAAFVIGYGVFTLCMLPASWSHAAAGFLYGPVGGVLVASLCSTAFAMMNFGLGRTLLRGWVERRVAASPRLRALDRVIGDGGTWVVFLIRLPPLSPFNPMSAILGASRVRFRDFVVGTWLGGLLPVGFFSYLGSMSSDLAALFAGESAGPGWMQLVPLVATLGACVLASRFAKRTLDEVMAASPGEAPGVGAAG